MIKYEVYEGVFDMDFADTSASIVDATEKGRLRNIINNINMYSTNIKTVTELYTQVLEDSSVAYFLPKITQQDVFARHFPELFEYNQYGENLFNCQGGDNDRYSIFYHIVASVENANVQEIPISDWQKKVLKWTMFLHDVGKPFVKKIDTEGRESFEGYEEKSVEISARILSRLDFSTNEKNLILKLVKYHNSYLTAEEATTENLTFLARELNDDKEMFFLLINIKDADAKAKSTETYNRFKIAKEKYYEFTDKYFDQKARKKIEIKATTVEGKEQSKEKNEENDQDEKITLKEVKEIIDEIITKKNVKVRYQPIIDLKLQNVYAYEVLTQINTSKKVKIDKLLEVAKDFDEYDKLQQVLFTNANEKFESVVNRESNMVMVNIDYKSYVNYVNKPRIYDMMSRNKVVVEFRNYENKDLTELQENIQTIHMQGGKVALDDFRLDKLTIEDLFYLDIDYIIPDMTYIKNISRDFEKQKYIDSLITYTISKDINLIAVGVEDKKILDTLKLIGTRLVQGYYFSKPLPEINMINEDIYNLLNSEEDQLI